MTESQAVSKAQSAINDLQIVLPLLSPFAPAQVGVAIAATNVVSAAIPVVQKLIADVSADVSQENANLKAAHDSMVAAVGKIDEIADS